jgi:Ca2+/H+ antiporter, TMEM165/GDT1 family
MRRNWARKVLKFALFAALFLTVFSYVVMRLWNWLTPDLFGWHPISFWQAAGLLVLSKILFGGGRGLHGGRVNWRRRMMERWEHMTPEEREKFRQSMRGRCGSFGQAPSTPKA